MWIAIILACLFITIFTGPEGLITAILFVVVFGGLFMLAPQIFVDPLGIYRRQWEKEKAEKERQLEEEIIKFKKEGAYSSLCLKCHVPVDFEELFIQPYNKVKYNPGDKSKVEELSSLYYGEYHCLTKRRKDCHEDTVFLSRKHEKMIEDAIYWGKANEKW